MLAPEFLLHRGGVFVDLLGQRVLVRVGSRLIRAVVRRIHEVGQNRRRIRRIRVQRAAADGRDVAFGLDRLNLILGLAGSDEDADAGANGRLPGRREGRADARLKAGLLRDVERRGVRIERAGVDVELDDPVVCLPQRRVVVVAETVVQREVGAQPPFVLGECRRSIPAGCACLPMPRCGTGWARSDRRRTGPAEGYSKERTRGCCRCR